MRTSREKMNIDFTDIRGTDLSAEVLTKLTVTFTALDDMSLAVNDIQLKICQSAKTVPPTTTTPGDFKFVSIQNNNRLLKY